MLRLAENEGGGVRGKGDGGGVRGEGRRPTLTSTKICLSKRYKLVQQFDQYVCVHVHVQHHFPICTIYHPVQLRTYMGLLK